LRYNEVTASKKGKTSMQPFDLESIRSLSVDERLTIVEAIWETIDADRYEFPLTDEQREELDRRIEDMDANPNDGEDWEIVRARLRQRP
jgi:putative addiction module component (TIGR02574 family)